MNNPKKFALRVRKKGLYLKHLESLLILMKGVF